MAKKKSKKELTATAFSKINDARNVRKKHEDRWKKIIRYYEGFAYTKDEMNTYSDYINVNIFKANVQTFQAATYYQNPKVYAKPANKFATSVVKTGPVIEAELNYWIKELGFQAQIRRCQLDWCLIGHAWMKGGYFGSISEKERAEDESAPEVETDLNIEDGQPFLRRVSPFNMLKDPAALTYEECRWVAEEIRFPWDEAKRRWPDLEKTKGTRTEVPSEVPAPTTSEKDRWSEKEQRASFILLVQYWYQKWNKETEKYELWVMLLCDGADEFLSDEKMELSVEGFPYDFLAWDEKIDSFYPQNIYDAAEDLFLSYDKLRSMEINHMRKNGRFYEILKDAYNQEDIDDLKKGIDGTMLKAESLDRVNIRAIEDAPLDPQHYVNIRQIEKEIQVILGLDENITSSTKKGITATQTERASQGTTIRLNTRRDMLGQFVTGAINKLWQILQGHHDIEDFVEVVGPEGARTLATINPSQIEGEYKIEMGVNSTAPPDKRQDVKDALDLYNIMRQDDIVDERWLVVNVFDKMQIPGVDDAVRAPDELEAETIQKENEQMEQGQPALVHAGDRHEMHMQQQGARAEELGNAAKAMNQQFAEAERAFKARHQQETQQLQQVGMPPTPEAQKEGQQLLGMQENAQQAQQAAQTWQQHVGEHQKFLSTSMGAGVPENPQMLSRRADRTSDNLAEQSAGFQGPGGGQ